MSRVIFQVIFACIPPPSIWGGWLCFFVSLGAVGVLTAIVGDLAGLFGCLVGLKDTVTAITFVALGTSLPDLFASKQAALQEETADNSIGNVTGSNSVNVFLGLGLSWVIAAVYWTSQVTRVYKNIVICVVPYIYTVISDRGVGTSGDRCSSSLKYRNSLPPLVVPGYADGLVTKSLLL